MVGVRPPVPGEGGQPTPISPGKSMLPGPASHWPAIMAPNSPVRGLHCHLPGPPGPGPPPQAQPRTRSPGPSLLQDCQGSGLAVPVPGQGPCQSCCQPQPPADSLPGLRPAWRSLGCTWPWPPSLGLSLALEPTSSLPTCPWPGLLAGPGCPPGMLGSGTGLPVTAPGALGTSGGLKPPGPGYPGSAVLPTQERCMVVPTGSCCHMSRWDPDSFALPRCTLARWEGPACREQCRRQQWPWFGCSVSFTGRRAGGSPKPPRAGCSAPSTTCVHFRGCEATYNFILRSRCVTELLPHH